MYLYTKTKNHHKGWTRCQRLWQRCNIQFMSNRKVVQNNLFHLRCQRAGTSQKKKKKVINEDKSYEAS